MTAGQAYRGVVDGFDGVARGEAVSTVGLLRQEVSDLGHALFIEVRVGGERHGLYPVPECEPERAAELICSSPKATEGETPPLLRLQHEGEKRGLTVVADSGAIVISDVDWGEILRQPLPDEQA